MPRRAACQAAARPAGPAPRTTRSALVAIAGHSTACPQARGRNALCGDMGASAWLLGWVRESWRRNRVAEGDRALAVRRRLMPRRLRAGLPECGQALVPASRICAPGLRVDFTAPAVVDPHDRSLCRLRVELDRPRRRGRPLHAPRSGYDKGCGPLAEGHEAIERAGLAAPVLHAPTSHPGLERDSRSGAQAVRPPLGHPQQDFEDVLPGRLDSDLLPDLDASMEHATSTCRLSHAFTPCRRDRSPRCPSCDGAVVDVEWFRHRRNPPTADMRGASPPLGGRAPVMRPPRPPRAAAGE